MIPESRARAEHLRRDRQRFVRVRGVAWFLAGLVAGITLHHALLAVAALGPGGPLCLPRLLP